MSTKLETDGSNVALTQLPLVTLKQNEKALLQALKGEKTISELSKEVKRNKTSVYRTLEQLEEKGLVKPSETHPVRYSITALGELILDSQKWLNHGRE